MVKVGIVGGTGYTGVELLRLLAKHPEVELTVITSRSEAGSAVADLYPNLRGHVELNFSEPNTDTLKQCDLVFSATPNGIAMNMARELVDAGVRMIDLAADFRLSDPAVWEKWYGMPHACEELLADAVYGLPEINREQIRKAQVIANPGCYPTAVQLGFLPLVEQGLVELQGIVADCKSGVSGAGRGANVATLQAESSESFKAYAVAGHRHWPEIKQGLARIANVEDEGEVGLTFVPHLLPMIRGIHATLYMRAKGDIADLQDLYEQRFRDEPFVDILPAGSHPETRTVRGSNVCRIALYQPADSDHIVVLSVIDNLVKGAAGQAVQNMNIMFGFDETMGLDIVALMP
ncbi:MAG: N-acetyl-gamma-glutamyl-phosphate reductase [Thiotrichales bacterium]|jgi:N-acetyl-gamma-glutamyl-phosphate reductase|nr:N-acetyl-gamma-glutamyl-phosphate reductase [Thiotrichales bacterium]MBT3613418.1 N-acetyl-gamma-glutamyl-phosphate reductase [Thiotrichales bacterium]MBT3751917.1 N-acetyl-gamma-glutamyl-phosphate reductase [Thiotrichales bacterium]MBT3837598.1 N-acetyl-gamma-glutamyl-phosphate reductase [Thiotrichales bacterium]MBT4152945.1 N-acetyl-gamma-glutamyl-phosphate reductase [Thiotrichales bacterium]